jgi:hypothetical protein
VIGKTRGGTDAPGPPKNQKTLSKDTEDYQKSVALDYLKGRQVLEKNNKK